jgi:hypothetical protein
MRFLPVDGFGVEQCVVKRRLSSPGWRFNGSDERGSAESSNGNDARSKHPDLYLMMARPLIVDPFTPGTSGDALRSLMSAFGAKQLFEPAAAIFH